MGLVVVSVGGGAQAFQVLVDLFFFVFFGLVFDDLAGFVVFVGDIGGEGAGGAGECEFKAVGGEVGFGQDIGWEGRGAEAGGVAAGELQAVEEGGGASGFKLAGGEGVDDDGERGLDGVAVFEGGELEAGGVLAGGGEGVAEAGVSAVEARVVEAEGLRGKGGRTALSSVGLDVAAEIVLHGLAPIGLAWVPAPPGGGTLAVKAMDASTYAGLSC